MIAVEPLKIFYCYASQDKKLRDELEKHLIMLKRLGQITLRLNREIVAGTNWGHEEDRRFQSADLILLLISPDFMSSDYHYGIEMRHALEKHDAGNVWVIPIILRPTAFWQKTPIGKLQALPQNGKAITERRNRDAAFTDVIKGISEVVAKLLTRKQELAFATKAGEGEFPKFTQVIGPLCVTCGARNPLGVITCANCGDLLFTNAAKSSQEVHSFHPSSSDVAEMPFFSNPTTSDLAAKPQSPTKVSGKGGFVCPNCNANNLPHEQFCSNCGAHLDSSAADAPVATNISSGGTSSADSIIFTPGAQLENGRYVIEKILGQGGMGTALLAKDTRVSNKLVVIKELVSDNTDPVKLQEDVRNFKREVETLAHLDHPLIPNVTASFQEDSHYFMVQDYVFGENLEDRIDRLKQPLRELGVLTYASQILDVLDYLEQQNPPIVHRDIKPANIIISRRNKQAYVVDFGIARTDRWSIVHADKFISKQTSALGTLGYAPPEQYEGNADPRSDLYALAAMLHHLLTNRDPRNYPLFVYPSVCSLNPKLSPEIERVLNRALMNDISQRYQTAVTMKQDIDEILAQRFGVAGNISIYTFGTSGSIGTTETTATQTVISGSSRAADALVAANISSGGTSSADSIIFTPGAQLENGRYVIEKILGQGGMGTTLLAKDIPVSNKLVVIKELVSDSTDPVKLQEDVRNFKREVETLAHLDHPLIPNVTDHFQQGSRYFMVQEYVPGENLEEYMDRVNQSMKERDVLTYASQILDVLVYMSQETPPIVHRDVKPANIIIGNKDKRAHLVDFGIAVENVAKISKRKQTSALGTPGYAPPEQYQGNADSRSDLYGLGATLHQLLTNRNPRDFPPFAYPPVRTLNPRLSPEIERVLNRSLMNDISQRYQTAVTMKHDVDEILAQRFGVAGNTLGTSGPITTTAATGAPPIETQQHTANLLKRIMNLFNKG